MKKLVIFLIPLIVSIPAFCEDKIIITENFSFVKNSGNNIQRFFNPDIESPVNHLFYKEEENHSKQYQTFQIPKFPQFSELIYFSRDSVIERKEQSREKPPLSKKRIMREVLAGGGLGVAGGLAGGLAGLGIGFLLAPDEDEYIGPIVGFFLGSSISYPIGTALGVYLVGDTGDETGSFVATLGGSLLGASLTYAAILLRILPSPLSYLSFFAVPPIFACIAFNMTRRYRSPPSSGTALLNFKEGQMTLGIPTVYFQPDTFGRRALNLNVSLINVEL
jgi:hypothetical protein